MSTMPTEPAAGMTRLTLDVPTEFVELAHSVASTPNAVLGTFIGDLCHVHGVQSTKAREHANAWFNGVNWPIFIFD